MADFTLPDYLKYSDTNTILNKIVSDFHVLRPDIDCSEGSILWDIFKPLALQLSRFIEFNLTETNKNIFPQYAYATMLDNHGEDRLIFRRGPIYAFGSVTFYGESGTIIPKGTIITTTSPIPADSVKFETIERVTIPDNGEIDAEIRALEPGKSGNVAPGTITALQVGNSKINEVTNKYETSGGADRESDEELRERIRIYDQRIFSSYVGTEHDYKLWTLEVPGVGSCRVEGCLDRTGDGGDGIVHISITDSEGRVASERLKELVREHLESPDDPENKKTAVNARLVLETPEIIPVNIYAEILVNKETDFNVAIDTIEREFCELTDEYIKSTFEDGIVYRRKIGAILDNIYGVSDYENLTLNNERLNLSFNVDQIPVLGEVRLVELYE